jgi:HPt (histidine-containing phosphotransfer) domain-containing protein
LTPRHWPGCRRWTRQERTDWCSGCLATYQGSLKRLLAQLGDARVPGLTLQAMRLAAHTLKSSSASMGALELARLCADDREAALREGRARDRARSARCN